ncbi:carboxyl-terminal processing protease [Tenacibaculum sp. MAR_2009_124]|uniref:S41 family peptidase n=1 Tax=Tenacibaculum sp. MAR_2009_124 TaxID=1250059 RepID=UPI00089BCC5D|nr:S41 family peptidase [Tenacibaculum sp. MAR_2009_124]SEC48648.1 carboxyl-terminal processing protease [Tenacibaculum sp. MAR_2009_124]
MKNKKFVIWGLITIIGVFFSFQSRFFEIAKQIEIYNNLFKEINMNYIDEVNPGDLTDKAIKNTLRNLDPYTNFYNEQDVEDARIRREGEYGGIGVMTYYTKKGIILSEIYKGFPADKAGLKPGDVIVEVDGQSLLSMENEQLSQMLKGSPGKEVSIKVVSNNETKDIKIKLDKVVVNPVPFFDMIDEETGYVVLTRFISRKATEEVKKAIDSLKERGMTKLVFDLRSNPGGSLFDAINITNLFIPKGERVVDTRGKIRKNSRVYKTSRDPLDTEMPVVVLIDDRSASASEIVSGALQDYDRAVVLGKRSFGKGLVQRYYELTYGTQAKITISKYYTPSGRCIQELDYANRDLKTGKVPKFSEGEVSSFKTKNGRTVYDGGGVTPDVKSKTTDKNETTKTLLKSRAVFSFANEYIGKLSSIDSLNYQFDELGFNEFRNFLLSKDTAFVTREERLFKKAYKTIKDHKKIKNEYENLQLKLKQEKVKEISKNKDVLMDRLEKEIMKNSFYREGMYRHQLQNDEVIKQAVDLLKNTNKYNSILKK